MVDIRGILPVSLIEWPGKISSVVFTGGCNLRCPFCHNKDLVIGLEQTDKISEDELLEKIKEKKEWIDAVCFTGGEPTLNQELPSLFQKIKEIKPLNDQLGIMIETNGTNPEMLTCLVQNKLVDFLAMDVKAPFDQYTSLLKCPENLVGKISESVSLIMQSELDYEFRITVAPDVVSLENIGKIGEQIKGAKKAVLQQFRQLVTLDPAWEKKVACGDDVLQKMAEILGGFVGEVKIR
ncbi:anaerobic ribonucleoside-triphosphate reductase activating protein [bacterium]|nr:MAG: anaerobic ribonucleoside-triphosphate reductase activating protein [bacterium]